MRERDDVTALEQAAAAARSRWRRIAGGGDGSSWLDQMEAGDVPADWPTGHAADVAELLTALGERARHTRAVAGLISDSTPQVHAGNQFVAATHQRLPLNRKERYFTGTVLPGLISDNGFVHLHRFLALCGLDVEIQDANSNPLDGLQPIEFFTEYGFAESVYSAEDRARFDDRPHERDTPDVVIVGPDWLLAVEAKMYHRPTRGALEEQLARQRVVVDYWARKLALDADRVAHVLLLPDALAQSRHPLSTPVVTWERVLAAYGTVGAPYWLGVLRSAIDRYGELASPEPKFRTNADDIMLGEQIAEGHADGTLVYAWVGRAGGLKGKIFAEDLVTGGWRDQPYEVRVDALDGNANWFPVGEFISATSCS